MVLPRFHISMGPSKSSESFSQLKQKGRILRPFLYVLMTLAPVLGNCKEDPQFSFEFDSVNYSEATSLHSFAGDWDDHINAGDVAISLSRLYLGYQHRSFSFQYVLRYDTYYRYANDTVQFLSLTENQLPLAENRQYQLYIEADKSASKGFRFGYNTWLSDDIELGAFFSLLRPTNLLIGSLNGTAVAVDSNDYDFSFSSDLVYKDDPLYSRASEELSGQGYSFDLAIHYIVNENWDIKIDLLDLAGELTFDDVPFTTADATSDIKNFDENGFVIFDPVVSGIEGNKFFTYKFNTQSHLAVDFKLPDENSIVFLHHHYKNINFQELKYVQRFDTNQIAWNLIPNLKAFGVTFKTPHFSIGLVTDDLDYKKMKFLNISSQFHWIFE